MRTKILSLLLLLLCLGGVFAQTDDTWYQGKPIRTISFDGLKNVVRSELDGVFKPYIGKEFSDDLYWDILQKLYALEYFEEITPVALPGDADRKTVLLQFTVTEKPVIKSISFNGNARLRATELLEKVTLKEGDIYNELKARIDERALRDYYLERGYANIKIVSETRTNSDQSVTLQFNITEGKQTVVSRIEFQGNKVIASKTLKKAMKLKEDTFFTSGIFVESSLEEDKSTIRRYYLERGYIDMMIENVIREIDTESNPEKNLVTLTFLLKEGEQFTYGGTSIQGNSIFSSDMLLGKIRLKEGDILNQNRFDEGFQAVADVYFENGYTSNYINRREIRDNERKRVSFEIIVVESERSHIEHIIIRGNTKTKENVIIREFTVGEGDIFSKSKLLDSIRNLYNLRYFSVVAPDIVQGSEKNLVDVIVNLEEQSTASIQFGVTFSGVTDVDTFPLSVFLQWEDKNFLGNGQTLSTNLTASPDTQSISLGFSENWFLGSPLTVSFELAYSHKSLFANKDILFPIGVQDPFLSTSEYSSATSYDDSYRMKYDQHSVSAGASTGYRWFPALAMVTLRGGINFSVVQNFYDETLYRPADATVRKQHGSWGWTNSVWSRLSLDDRDLSYDPSTGWFASQQVSVYGLVPDLETDYYIKSETKGELYFTLVDYPLFDTWNLKFVLAGYSALTFLVPAGDREIGAANKLYIDGMFTGRRWNSLYSSHRGQLMVNHWLELRMPIAPGVIAADFFFEAIAVKDTITDITDLSLDDYYFSFGPSLRFSIPQFPLRLMFVNTFTVPDGKLEWSNGTGPDWKFVLSFNIANM